MDGRIDLKGRKEGRSVISRSEGSDKAANQGGERKAYNYVDAAKTRKDYQ